MTILTYLHASVLDCDLDHVSLAIDPSSRAKLLADLATYRVTLVFLVICHCVFPKICRDPCVLETALDVPCDAVMWLCSQLC